MTMAILWKRPFFKRGVILLRSAISRNYNLTKYYLGFDAIFGDTDEKLASRFKKRKISPEPFRQIRQICQIERKGK